MDTNAGVELLRKKSYKKGGPVSREKGQRMKGERVRLSAERKGQERKGGKLFFCPWEEVKTARFAMHRKKKTGI